MAESFKVEQNIIDVLQVVISEYPDIESHDKAGILLEEFINQSMGLYGESVRLLGKIKN